MRNSTEISSLCPKFTGRADTNFSVRIDQLNQSWREDDAIISDDIIKRYINLFIAECIENDENPDELPLKNVIQVIIQ